MRIWEESRHSGRIVVTEHAVLRDVYHPAAVFGSFAHVRESEIDCMKLKRALSETGIQLETGVRGVSFGFRGHTRTRNR